MNNENDIDGGKNNDIDGYQGKLAERTYTTNVRGVVKECVYDERQVMAIFKLKS